jgi:hypothetical protein
MGIILLLSGTAIQVQFEKLVYQNGTGSTENLNIIEPGSKLQILLVFYCLYKLTMWYGYFSQA